jgi:hypothetical protein
MSIRVLAPIALLSIALAGCGGSDAQPKPKAGAPVEKSIFVSVVDCEASGKFKTEDCEKGIEKAIRMHEKQAPSYKSEGSCEEKEGAGKCERLDERVFRPRLAAFLFDNTEPPTAKPLYLTLDGGQGFRGAEAKEVFLAKNDDLIFSKSASDLFELHGKKGKKK